MGNQGAGRARGGEREKDKANGERSTEMKV